jgi:hypothetical protein
MSFRQSLCVRLGNQYLTKQVSDFSITGEKLNPSSRISCLRLKSRFDFSIPSELSFTGSHFDDWLIDALRDLQLRKLSDIVKDEMLGIVSENEFLESILGPG